MTFQSAQFFLFFLATLLIYFVVPARFKSLTLFAASCWFYAYAGWGYMILLLVVIGFSYVAARLIGRTNALRARRGLFVAALVVLFGNLCFFKYYDLFGKFLNETLYNAGLPVLLPDSGLLAPLGISFYTFAVTGYLIDVYQHVAPAEKNMAHYAAFVGFFPLISSGPIERGRNMLPQFAAPKPFDYERFCTGASRMLWGFFKKFVVANTIAGMVDAVFVNLENYTGPYLALAALLYSYQIYCDFSGYSDIAIGAACALGFTTMENFARPFAARSFTELWQRWHISLTGWFRDYVFTPLTFATRGTRWPRAMGCICLASIFLLSGIWHGASWTFFFWGALNAVYMIVGKLTLKKRRKYAKTNRLYRNPTCKAILQVAIVYLLFTSCIVFFRAPSISDALYVYQHLFTGWGTALLHPGTVVAALKSMGIGRVSTLLLAATAVFVEFVEWRAALQKQTVGQWLRACRPALRVALYYAMLLFLAFFGVLGTSSFIYNNF